MKGDGVYESKRERQMKVHTNREKIERENRLVYNTPIHARNASGCGISLGMTIALSNEKKKKTKNVKSSITEE